jgi:TfoX/Sxy family transcriptional regulator of competence genes
MAYDEFLADRVRRRLNEQKALFEEKKMMGGLCFMVDDKMCVGIVQGKLMARIGLEVYPLALKKKGCSQMDFTGKPMKGYVFVDPSGIDSDDELSYWVDLCLQFNPFAKSSKKKRKK